MSQLNGRMLGPMDLGLPVALWALPHVIRFVTLAFGGRWLGWRFWGWLWQRGKGICARPFRMPQEAIIEPLLAGPENRSILEWYHSGDVAASIASVGFGACCILFAQSPFILIIAVLLAARWIQIAWVGRWDNSNIVSARRSFHIMSVFTEQNGGLPPREYSLSHLQGSLAQGDTKAQRWWNACLEEVKAHREADLGNAKRALQHAHAAHAIDPSPLRRTLIAVYRSEAGELDDFEPPEGTDIAETYHRTLLLALRGQTTADHLERAIAEVLKERPDLNVELEQKRLARLRESIS